jgi:hypothetical protein
MVNRNRLGAFPLLLLLTSAALGAALPQSTAPVLPFIEDDYDQALALARQKKLPIFVEAWAPW